MVTRWVAVCVSAGLLELPFPIAGPLPPWRSVFAWFALVPLLWAVLAGDSKSERHPLKNAFLLAYVCGVLWYIGNCYWIYDTMLIHGGLPPVVSALILLLFSLVLGLYFGLFGLGLALVRRATGSVRWALAFAPFLWVALELAGARITSVPWDQLGYSQVDNGVLNGLPQWTGAYGVSFLVVLINAEILRRFMLPSLRRRFVGFLWISPFVLLFALGFLAWRPKMPPTSATAVLIQPNLDVEHTGYWSGPGEYERHIANFIKLGGERCGPYVAGMPQTGAATVDESCYKNPPPGLIVWPESPAPFFEQDPRFKSAMAEVAQADQAPIIAVAVGSDFSVAEHDWLDHVSAIAFNAAGSEVGRYDKIHLVPWGEYVPYPQVFFFAKKLTGKVASYTPGSVRNVFLLQSADGESHRYGVFICYESVFADEVRSFALNGAEVFVNVSDDGWYGDTSAPWQHLNMVRMRAIENRRWILRATNDGVTAVIDSYGRVRQSIPRHQVSALAAQYGFRSDVTFYTEHGDVFAWVCAILSIGVAGWSMIIGARKAAAAK